jgi:hypothetical protein
MRNAQGRPTILLVVAAVTAAVLTLAACAPSPAETPPGPSEGTITPAPESTGGANATGTEGGAHAGGVSATTYTAVVEAIQASGIDIASPSSLRMTTADSRRITVEGGGMTRGSETVRIVFMERTDGEWRVAETR